MIGVWHIAHITHLDKRTGLIEAYCSKLGKTLRGQLPELVNSGFMLQDKVRLFVETLPYALRIKMVTKVRK